MHAAGAKLDHNVINATSYFPVPSTPIEEFCFPLVFHNDRSHILVSSGCFSSSVVAKAGVEKV